METKKISKWDAAPESFSNMHSIINKVCDNLIDYDIDHSCKKILINALSEVLDDYNKLEAKHQLDCGLISDYAEENARLKQKNEKASNNIRDLRRVLEENDIATYLNPVTVSWGVANVALQKKTEHFNTQLDNLREKLKEMEKSRNNWHAHYVEQCARHIDLLDKLRWALEDKGILVEWSEAALKWNIQSRIDRQEIEDKDKLIEELRQKIEDLEIKTSYYVAHITSLKREIEKLEKENKELRIRCEEIDDLRMENKNLKYLKALLEKDGEFGKNVGKCIAESIREGCDKGIYELHPYTRVEIHVEETNNMPTTFDRHAIPRIAVTFNNSQTEMERDTARHECEELNEKIDTVWRANDELNRKIKELKKENIDLKTTLAICERDANTAKNLCDGISFQAEHARNKTPWFTNTSFNNEEEK